SKSMKEFANESLKAISGGELSVSDLESSSITLVIDPVGPRPVQIPLEPVSTDEALRLSTDFVFSVGVQAQSRQNRISAPSHPMPPITSSSHAPRIKEPIAPSSSIPPLAELEAKQEQERKRAEERIKALEKEVKSLSTTKQQNYMKSVTPANPVSLPSNNSKANPTRVKRVAKKMQFEDDD
ncbi:hypothetical protein SISNIDRAFT_459558, partial [Sistotremastrum niveocremeum HHB9708]